ncbi:MAG: response regulator [Bdellovibrionota bacterium]
MSGAEKLNVLIIEEKSDLRTFYMNALIKTGNYEVKNTASSKEALDFLEKNHEQVNLIIFDWFMPEVPGYVFCQKIRADNRFNHIDMLICSSKIDEEDSFLMVEMDIHYVMPKLTNAVEYIAKVDEVRKNYYNVQSIVTKLKNLQTLLNEVQVDQCEELFKIPEIEKEINANPRYVHLGGELRILRKKYEEAADFMRNFLTKNSARNGAENLKSLSTLGKALCLAGKFDDALLVFERLEAKSPKNLSHKIMSGDALLGMDKLDAAENKYSEVLEKDSGYKEALVGLAKVSAVQGDFEESKNFFSKIEGNFESRALASFFNNRGVALVRKGDINGAITFYENSLQFLDKFKGHVYFNLGMAYYRIGNIISAVQSFQAALNNKEADQLADKTILKELQEKGVDGFIAEFNRKHDVLQK